jgi:hypothetical protein
MINEKSDKLKIWQDRIAIMFLIQEEIQKLDKVGLWQYYYPELAATEQQLIVAESHLGHTIDDYYRDFLMCANGWKSFSQTINLFGSEDLMGSDLMNYALDILNVMDNAYSFEYTGFSKEDFLPIAATYEEKDLYVITRPTSRQPGIVIWFSGQEIERYQNFEEYFLQ